VKKSKITYNSFMLVDFERGQNFLIDLSCLGCRGAVPNIDLIMFGRMGDKIEIRPVNGDVTRHPITESVSTPCPIATDVFHSWVRVELDLLETNLSGGLSVKRVGCSGCPEYHESGISLRAEDAERDGIITRDEKALIQ